MLETYHMENHRQAIPKWYDGYLFGTAEVYNPWSLIRFVQDHVTGSDALPAPYWANTGSNSIVKSLVERMDDETGQMQWQLEYLMNGGTIEKPIREDIAYDNIYDFEDNLWNFLFFTGYLKETTLRQEMGNRIVTMAIPNMDNMK